MTKEGDVVLVTIDNKPAFFARIESITEDVKPGWYRVRMLVLQIPLVVVTWILRDSYINGEEFTMGGHPITLTKVEAPPEEFESEEEIQPSGDGDENRPRREDRGKVVSLVDRQKKRRT